MNHDPLCPFAKWDDVDCYQHDAGVRICDLIAKVRQDMLAKCIAAVQAIPDSRDALVWFEKFRDDENDPEKITFMTDLDDVLKALRALEEKP